MTVEEGGADAAEARPSRGRGSRRRRVAVTVITILVVGLDAALVYAVGVWKDDTARLRSEASTLGEKVATAQAVTTSRSKELALVGEQADAAAAWSADLEAQVATERAPADAYRDAALALDQCSIDRASLIASLWAGSSGTGAMEASANAECSAAKATLDDLEAGH